MSTEARANRPRRLFLPALAIAVFSAGVANAVITLFVVEIARTFFGSANSASIAAVNQLTTLNAAGEIAFAILLSVLIVRFRHKSLLLVGAILVTVAAIGSVLAPSFLSLMLFITVEGAGSIIVSIVAFTLVGDLLPPEAKSKTISYIVSASALATLVLVLLLNFLVDIGGWRYTFLFVSLPVSAASVVIASLILPSEPRQPIARGKENPYTRSFRQILTNRSAAACLISNILTVAGTQVAVFAIAFYRTQFGASREFTGLTYDIAAIIFVVAPLISSRLTRKFGAKRIAVICTLLAATFTITFFFVPILFAAVLLDMLHVWFAAMAVPAFIYVVLEQVPSFRGTMMSLNAIFNNVGNAIAAAVGSALLILASGRYSAVGLTLGIMTIIGAAVLLFLVKERPKPRIAPAHDTQTY